MDIHRFVMEVEKTLNAGGVAVTRGAVVGQDEVVILLPGWEVAEFAE